MLLADATTTPDLTTWIQIATGVPALGALIVALLRGWLVSGREHERVIEERDKEREERLAAQRALVNDVIPTLASATRILEEAARAIERSEWGRR